MNWQTSTIYPLTITEAKKYLDEITPRLVAGSHYAQNIMRVVRERESVEDRAKGIDPANQVMIMMSVEVYERLVAATRALEQFAWALQAYGGLRQE